MDDVSSVAFHPTKKDSLVTVDDKGATAWSVAGGGGRREWRGC